MILERFPRRTLRAERILHRIHRLEHGAWWFSDDGHGRFDPLARSGYGCCYSAEVPLGAWIGTFRKQMALDEADVRDRRLASLTVGRALRLADLTSARALAFGVTASLGAADDYGPSQAFAAAVLGEGFDGVRYLLRHDPRQKLYGVGLFGPAGERSAEDSRWPTVESVPIPEDLIAEAARRFGYRVLPVP